MFSKREVKNILYEEDAEQPWQMNMQILTYLPLGYPGRYFQTLFHNFSFFIHILQVVSLRSQQIRVSRL